MSKREASGPSSLTMDLFAPGMTIIHRAGLGGLATTLRSIEWGVKTGKIVPAKAPGGSWPNGKPPWSLEPTQIIIDFGKPEGAEPFLKRLFAWAFQIRDGLIFLPGHFSRSTPSFAVSAELQQGLLLTFLQHGRVRRVGKDSMRTYEVDNQMLNVRYRPCSAYKHQEGWQELCAAQKCIKNGDIEVIGPLNPGAVVRHVAYQADTKVCDPPERILPLYFSIVGCLALPINRGCGVLVIPDVQDLVTFAQLRPLMTPSSPRDCRIASAGDAALQAQLRVRAKREAERLDLPACQTFTFQPTPWAKQQKSRVKSLFVPGGEDESLARFEFTLAELRPHVLTRTVKKAEGRGRKRKETEERQTFWVDSVVRPLIADNLALDRPWYQGFVNLVRGVDPNSKRPRHTKLFFEKEGLSKMIASGKMWEDQGEAALVRGVHEAIGRRYGQIAAENSNPFARKKRWKGEYDRWRLAFAGAKTEDQFRHAFCDLLSRAPGKGAVQDGWQGLLPWLSGQRWELARDLSLLAIASYKGKGAEAIESDVGESVPTTDQDA